MCRAWSKFGFYANSGAVSFKQNSKMKIPPHQPAVADRPLAADAVWRLGAGDWAPPPPGLANRVPLTPPQPPIHSSTPKSSPSYPQHTVAAHPPWASSSPMAIPTAAALHPSCHRCHLPRPQPRLPDRPADPIRPSKVTAACCCGPCQPACVAGLPRAVVGQAEATGGDAPHHPHAVPSLRCSTEPPEPPTPRIPAAMARPPRSAISQAATACGCARAREQLRRH